MKGRVRMAVGLAALVVVLAAAACGTGGGGVTDAGPAPTREPGPADGTGGEAAAPAATPGGARVTVSLFFTRGDTVEVVRRAVPKVPGIGAESVKALLAGPTPDEAKAGLGTAIPEGTRFLGLTITDGVARVDLSRQFGVGAGDEGYTVRLAQVTCTLDQFESVNGVRFALDGKLIGVPAGNGSVVERPVTCQGYRGPAGPGTASDSGIWPYTSAAEADAAAGRGERAFTDPAATAREFAARYLGMADPVVFGFQESEPGAGEVGVGFRYGEGRTPVANPRVTTNVIVRQLGRRGATGPWTVVAAWAPNIEVQSPQPMERVSSPVRLSGRASAFEGNVAVTVREDGMLAGASLGEGFVTGRGDGQLGPFNGQVAFRSPTKPGGAVLFVDRSAADGSVMAATVVRVRF